MKLQYNTQKHIESAEKPRKMRGFCVGVCGKSQQKASSPTKTQPTECSKECIYGVYLLVVLGEGIVFTLFVLLPHKTQENQQIWHSLRATRDTVELILFLHGYDVQFIEETLHNLNWSTLKVSPELMISM
jgi:hypothetical protein